MSTLSSLCKLGSSAASFVINNEQFEVCLSNMLLNLRNNKIVRLASYSIYPLSLKVYFHVD